VRDLASSLNLQNDLYLSPACRSPHPLTPPISICDYDNKTLGSRLAHTPKSTQAESPMRIVSTYFSPTI
jgi:hypothetical protein